MLREFVRFLREERELPLLVHLAGMHYQLEAIHPFNDGNGRVGRLLISLLLCPRESLPQPLLYLSAFFEQHRQDYYDCLLDVSRRGAWSEWITFFARGVTQQSRDAATRAGKLLGLWQNYRHRVANIVRSPAVLRLVDELFASPFITISRASEVMDVAFKSARNSVDRFVEAGILHEITGQQRYRVYRADEIFRLLDEELESNPSGTA
jgi:Fic family protein